MTISMADPTTKAQKVKVLPVAGKDPEAQKQEMLRREEERLRASARKEAIQRRARERGRPLTGGYLEPWGHDDSDNDNSVSIAAFKKRCELRFFVIKCMKFYSYYVLCWYFVF